MRCGLIVPIYKSGKPIGIPKSYRPVMLLSVVRKVLTSILTKRSTEFMQEYVRESQAGFRPNHSTADGVFYTRMLCERSLLGDWSYSGALLDFSGAFDTVIRESALSKMSEAEAYTSTIRTLISDTSAKVKLCGELSTPFATNIGVVQGDPLSPLMYIMYAESSMRKIDETLDSNNSTVPTSFTQYADDTTVHDTNEQSTKIKVQQCEPIFAEDNLNLNVNKTQFFTASKTDDSWRSVKLLGSHLGSATDIAARISAANRAFNTISWKRHSLQSRFCMFRCLILPILLYNCALWTLTKALSDDLDIWHRKKLRYLLNISHPHHISNDALYNETKESPISSICRKRRLLWFAHVIREGPNSSSFQALEMVMDTSDIKKPRGRPPTRWIDTIKNDLKPINISLSQAVHLAEDRLSWLDVVNRCVDLV